MIEKEKQILFEHPPAGGVFSRSVPLFLMVLGLGALYYVGLYNYLLFHSLVEIFSIVIAFTIFIIAWNSREHLLELADTRMYAHKAEKKEKVALRGSPVGIVKVLDS